MYTRAYACTHIHIYTHVHMSVKNIGSFSFSIYFFFHFFAIIEKAAEKERRVLTADPGFIGVAPGSGVITWPPVSVCQKVSDMLHLP